MPDGLAGAKAAIQDRLEQVPVNLYGEVAAPGQTDVNIDVCHF